MSAYMALIEIFRDAHGSVEDIEPVIRGIGIIGPLVDGLTIVRADRQIKLGNPDAPAVNLDVLRWPSLQTSFAIVVTSRNLECTSNDSEGDELLKNKDLYRLGGIAVVESGVAVISTKSAEPPLIARRTAHEIAHLYQAEHCAVSNCIMYPVGKLFKADVMEEIRTRHFLRRVKEEKVKTTTHTPAMSFCDGCTKSVQQGSKNLLVKHALQAMQ